MPTYIDGIGASQNIDSSGEIVDIAGLDISSLEVDGSLNWEHKKDFPEQLVGKILKAKKIFSEKDCEDDRQKYFWNKCKTPFLYIVGELFDDYVDSARHVAGLFRYDTDHRGRNERDIIGFSVEGAKLPGAVNGMVITRSIARKITITNFPCNKQSVAEMVPTSKKSKDGIDNIFKTESFVEIEVFKGAQQQNVWDLVKKEALHKKVKEVKKDEVGLSYGSSTGLTGAGPISPTNMMTQSEPDMGRSEEMTKALKVVPPSTANPNGSKIGRTSSGKDIHSHAQVGSTGFSPDEHHEAAHAHLKAAAANPRMFQHHNNKAALHNQASVALKDKAAKRMGQTPVGAVARKSNRLHDPHMSGSVKYKKSEVVAPGMQGDSVEANQKQQRARREQEAYPNNSKHHWDKHKVNHSESNPQNIKRASIPNKQEQHPTPQAGAPRNNMLHNNILAPKQTMHKAMGGGPGGGLGAGSPGISGSTNIIMDSGSTTPAPKKPKLGKLNKAIEAGSGIVSPDRLVGGAALGKESLDKGGAYSSSVPKDKKIKELQEKIDSGSYKLDSKKTAEAMLKHPKRPIKKSEAYKRIEQEYQQWDKREEFENFMKSRMPYMTKGEIKAFGQAMIMNKSMRLEKSLEDMTMDKALKFNHPAGHGSKHDATPKSKIPEQHKGKAPELKGVVHSEIEHVEPHYSGSHDAVYLRSGHRSEHQPKGKYKVGDKVTMHPHIQGTHILEHKK